MFWLVLPGLLALWGLTALLDDDDGTPAETNDEDTPDTSSGTNSDTNLVDMDEDDGSTTTITIGGEGDPSLITGDGGDNGLAGTTGDNIILAGAGNDGVLADAGNDILVGEDGDDRLRGEDGNDLIIGGPGADALFGALGDDWVEGDAGDDSVNGGLGTDTVLGGTGADLLNGGANPDILFGGDVTGTPLSVPQLVELRDGTPLADILGVSGTALAPLIDDGDADTLNGDGGSDALILGAGDVGTGGDQQDAFLVFAEQAVADTPATITDFAPSETIAVITGPGAPPTLTVQDDAGDALVLADGTVIARVEGAAGTVAPDDIVLIEGATFDDLDPNGGQVVTPTVNTQTLTDGADTFTGTDTAQDRVDGGGGDDALTGAGEADRLRGEDGSDILLGEDGDDTLQGGGGQDAAPGGAGNDIVSGGSEADWVEGGAGNDQVDGNSQDDVVIGGDGADTVSGGNGDDLLIGGDALAASPTVQELEQARPDFTSNAIPPTTAPAGPFDDGDADILLGGNGSDALILGANDTGTGGSGVDAFFIAPGDGTSPAVITDLQPEDELTLIKADAQDGDIVSLTVDGADTLVSLNNVVQVRVVGVAPDAIGPIGVSDPLILRDLDELVETSPDDVVRTTLTENADSFIASGGDVENRVNALAGDDIISTAGDDDFVRGDEGADVIIGGDGQDELYGSAGADLIQGNSGGDRLLGGSDDDWLNGGQGDDEVIANGGDDIAIGGLGADDIQGNVGDDLLIGGELFSEDLSLSDLILVRNGGTPADLSPGALDDGQADTLDGGVGNDTLVGGSGDQLTGGEGEDTFMAYANAPTEAVLVNDYAAAEDALAVVYDNGAPAPEISVTNNGAGVYTVLANGAPVAVVASAESAVTAADVMLVERLVDGSIPLN